jgi:fused signal recognition particle receptor
VSFLDKIRQSLTKTRDAIFGGVAAVLQPGRKLTEEDYESLEAALLRADVGPATTDRLLDDVRRRLTESSDLAPTAAMCAAIRAVLEGTGRAIPEGTVSFASRVPEGIARPVPTENPSDRNTPHVTLVIGVNGSGKTTTIAKLANRYKQAGNSVLLVACDTFRAAAGDQLTIWAERAGVEIVQAKPGADPAAVAFDGMARAKSRGVDEVIVDTAGRLHVQTNLMAELEKIRRVIGRAIPGAPHETLLVLDATVGQNGLAQAREFGRALAVTGVALTKLDGTAKGGIVLAVADSLGIPIRWIGVGEGMEDLLPFEPDEFAAALVPAAAPA